MEGRTPYLCVHSRQTLPQGPPISYEGPTDSWQLDLVTCAYDLEIFEPAGFQSTNTNIQTYPSDRFHRYSRHSFVAKDEVAGISQTENHTPPV